MAGQVEVRVTSKRLLTETVIRPVAAGVQAKVVDDHTLTFRLDRPRKLSIEPDGRSGPLLLFANPMQKAPPKATTSPSAAGEFYAAMIGNGARARRPR